MLTTGMAQPLPFHSLSKMTSNTSGSWGCGAWHYDQWFQEQSKQDNHITNIAVRELVPILIGAFIWGKQWKGASITADCDIAAVVATILNSGYTADDHMMLSVLCRSTLLVLISCSTHSR